jgi:hypothetical protein
MKSRDIKLPVAECNLSCCVVDEHGQVVKTVCADHLALLAGKCYVEQVQGMKITRRLKRKVKREKEKLL